MAKIKLDVTQLITIDDNIILLIIFAGYQNFTKE